MTDARTQDRGPGRFVTHRVRALPGGGHLVATSRRHRKGLRPHRVDIAEGAEFPPATHASAFRHFWAPGRLAWWVAVLFMIGAALFTVGGFGATDRIFVIGALFFTAAAWLQWLEALNGDVAQAMTPGEAQRWRWFGWRPRNLGYLASTVQLVGTIMFNFNTIDATFPDLSREQTDLLVWAPNMVGCVCFLVASYLAYAEVSQGVASLATRSVSWWIAVANLLGSVAFQISALYSFAGSGPAVSFYTTAGGACFLIGSYLMIPELFDE